MSAVSATDGTSSRISNTDVPCKRPVGLFPPFGERTNNCGGTFQFPVCRLIDCSGLRHHSSPNRVSRYEAQKAQNEAYQDVLSPAGSSGRAGMYQPFMTSLIKPFFSRRSRWVRLKSLARRAT